MSPIITGGGQGAVAFENENHVRVLRRSDNGPSNTSALGQIGSVVEDNYTRFGKNADVFMSYIERSNAKQVALTPAAFDIG